jgi:L-amino acid N-acyltransferase YncA
MLIRNAVEADLPGIVDIYNASIPGRTSTTDLEPIEVESRREWFATHRPDRRPLWVAAEADDIAGWIGLTSFYAGRPAYDATAEVSLYIAPGFQRRGLGTKLLRQMIAECPRLGVTTLLAMYFDHNSASRALFRSLGFEECGHLERIALLDGTPRGLIIAALRIPA